MKKLIIYIFSFFVGTVASSTEVREFGADGLKKLIVKNYSGDVKISVSEDEAKAYVTAEKINFSRKCRLNINREDEGLVIEVEKKGWFNSNNCSVNLDIKVPREIFVDLKNGSGDINVSGIRGNVHFRLGSGDFNIDAQIGELEGKSGSGLIKTSGSIGHANIKMGSGSLELRGLTAGADLKTGSGDLMIQYKSVPVEAELNIKTGSGNATVLLPSSTSVLSHLISGSGRIYNEIGDTSDASFKVVMKAGSGDLKLIKK